MNIYESAELLGDKLVNKFFNDVDELFDIIIEKDYINYIYYFRFDILYTETIEALNNLNKYMGYNGIQIETKVFKDYEEPLIYYWFILDEYKINSHLEKVKLEDDTNKYNL